MPCVAMTPAMPAPHDGRCGANTAAAGASSATIRPLPTHHQILTVAESTQVSSSVYTRFWKYLFQYWNSSQPATNASSSLQSRRRRMSPSRLSASSEWQRVEMLHELEAHTHMRGTRAMQATCSNCHQRFFRAHGADADAATTETKTQYCSLDCKTSALYRASVQHSINLAGGFDDMETPTFSRTDASRL